MTLTRKVYKAERNKLKTTILDEPQIREIAKDDVLDTEMNYE